MAKELNEKVTVIEGNEPVTVSEIEESTSNELALKLFREKFVASGKEYWGYFCKGNIAGKAVKIEFVPLDNGGYEVLDFVFLFADEANINVQTIVSKNNMGRRVSYTSYEAYNLTPDGKKLSSPIKPARRSDESLFNMAIQYL